jgi:hypothetical protein
LNASFLRPDAYLGIVLLTNEDDCSAPRNTPLFSLNGGKQSITNPLGPIANYRCNRFGHICRDPGIRIAQFTNAFPNSVLASICDPNYHGAMQAIANKLGAMSTKQVCVPLGPVQNDAQGTPACTVTNRWRDSAGSVTDVAVASCAATGGTAPCWTLVPGNGYDNGSYTFKLLPDPAVQDKTSISATVKCAPCQAGSTMPGC